MITPDPVPEMGTEPKSDACAPVMSMFTSHGRALAAIATTDAPPFVPPLTAGGAERTRCSMAGDECDVRRATGNATSAATMAPTTPPATAARKRSREAEDGWRDAVGSTHSPVRGSHVGPSPCTGNSAVLVCVPGY